MSSKKVIIIGTLTEVDDPVTPPTQPPTPGWPTVPGWPGGSLPGGGGGWGGPPVAGWPDVPGNWPPLPGPRPPQPPPIAGWPTVPGWPGGSLPGGEGGWGGPPTAGWPSVPGNWPSLPNPRPPQPPGGGWPGGGEPPTAPGFVPVGEPGPIMGYQWFWSPTLGWLLGIPPQGTTPSPPDGGEVPSPPDGSAPHPDQTLPGDLKSKR